MTNYEKITSMDEHDLTRYLFKIQSNYIHGHSEKLLGGKWVPDDIDKITEYLRAEFEEDTYGKPASRTM